MAKSALITFGNEESYGLVFVGGELLEHGQDIRFFEGDRGDWNRIVEWSPDFLMFSPLAVFFSKALELARSLKRAMPKVTVVFGGHHVLADEKVIYNKEIDVAVKGPVRGSMSRILGGEKGLIKTVPTTPEDMPRPARKEYYRDIPRLANRYRKTVISMLGCSWDCSYCSSASSHIKSIFGKEKFKKYYLKRRPVSAVLDEIREIMQYDTKEIEYEDDDIFAGDEGWMLEFLGRYDFGVPMYVSCCSISAMRASGKLLKELKKHVNVIGVGIQAIRPSTLRLCGRRWDNEKQMKAAYDRLVSFGYRVNLQGIVGFPVDDPLEDAIETVMGMQRIGKGSICSLYPLMIYPGTKMEKMCKDWPKNEHSVGDTNTGVCDLQLAEQKQLKNLCKLATFIVKYGINEELTRILINADYGEVYKDLSSLRYKHCVTDRLGDIDFEQILKTMKLKF